MAILNPEALTVNKKKKTTTSSTSSATPSSSYTVQQLMDLPTAQQAALYKASQGAYGAAAQQAAISKLGTSKLTPSGDYYGVLPGQQRDEVVAAQQAINANPNVSDATLKSILSTRTYSGASGGGSSLSGVANTSSTPSRGTASSVAGKTANSAGSFYGAAGTNTMGTSFDAAGNRIIGQLGGKNVITGGGGSVVDRTAGITTDPVIDYFNRMQQGTSYDSIYKQMAKERQQQIDAIEMSAKQAVSAEQQAGAQDLARQRSMNLRAGLGGSDFGASAKAEVRNRTNQNIQGIEAQKQLQIGNAIDRIEQLAQSRFQIQQSAMQQGFQNMFQVQQYTQAQEQQMRAQTLDSLKELGKAGVDIQTVKEQDPQLYERMMQASGMSDVEMEAVLNNAKPAPERIDYQYKVAGNKLIAYGVDPVTGTLKSLEQEVDLPENYSITTMPDGTVLALPDNWNGDTSLIKTVGNYAKPTVVSGGTTGGTVTTPTVGLTDAFGKPLKLTATQTDALAGYDNTVQAAQDAIALLQSGVQTGPIAGRMMAIGKFRGNVDTNQLKLEQILGKIKADFMKAMSGAAVSEQEVQRLSKFLPDMNDQETVIESKLGTLQQEVARSKQNLLNTLGAVGQTRNVIIAPDGTEVEIVD